MLSHKEEIGKMDKRFTFQQMLIGENESNENEEQGWEDVVTVYASKNEKSGTEKYAADKLTGFQGVVWKMRFRDDVDIKMRGFCENRTYNIISISEIGRKRFMEVVTESGYEYVSDVT